MRDLLDAVGRRALFTFDPEFAHGLSIAALKTGLPVGCGAKADTRLELRIGGISVQNPLGTAAGFDKNAEVPDALLALGFGFAEVGTVTPLPQSGNAKPRIFRLTRDEAVINRLGFNNEGHEAAFRRLSARRRSGVVGVNIGANKDSADRIADYVAGVVRFASLASYLTVNISSPNTPGLRNLHGREQLSELLLRVAEARKHSSSPAVPILLKIAPDLHEGDLDDIAAEVEAHGIDGVVVSNTTISRDGLQPDPQMSQHGGLSGKPLFGRSTAVLARMRKRVGAKTVLVGVGGVNSAEAALEKIRAGADLVQLYTGMIYAGPSLPGRIVGGLSAYCDREGLRSVFEIRDSRVDHWMAQPII